MVEVVWRGTGTFVPDWAAGIAPPWPHDHKSSLDKACLGRKLELSFWRLIYQESIILAVIVLGSAAASDRRAVYLT